MILENDMLCSMLLPSAVRCAPVGGLAREWRRIDNDVLPRLSETGWDLGTAVRMMAEGERDLPTLVKWLDKNECAIIEHVLVVVTALEDAGVYFNTPAHAHRKAINTPWLNDIVIAIVGGAATPGAEWAKVESRVLNDLEKGGWELSEPVKLMRSGVRDLIALTREVDVASAALVELLLDLVLERERRPGGATAPGSPTRAPAPAPSLEETLAEAARGPCAPSSRRASLHRAARPPRRVRVRRACRGGAPSSWLRGRGAREKRVS